MCICNKGTKHMIICMSVLWDDTVIKLQPFWIEPRLHVLCENPGMTVRSVNLSAPSLGRTRYLIFALTESFLVI